MAKERVNILDLNKDAPPPAIPTTLEAAEAKGGNTTFGRDGPRRMMGSDRDERRGDDDRRDDRDMENLSFSRGTASRGGGDRRDDRRGGDDMRMSRGGDNMMSGMMSRPGGMRDNGRNEHREMRRDDRDNDRYGDRDTPRQEMADSEMTFSRGVRRTDNNNDNRNNNSSFGRDGPRRMNDDRDGGRDGDFGMRRSGGSRPDNRDNRDNRDCRGVDGGDGSGFARGTRSFSRASRMADSDADMMRRTKHTDGLTSMQRRKIEREAVEKKAEEERAISDKRREEEEAKREKKAEAAAEAIAERAVSIQESVKSVEEEIASKEAEDKPFTPPSFRKKELETLAENIRSALASKDTSELETLCESFNHDIYNAPACFLLPFIVQSFKFGFDQKGKMSTDDYVQQLVDALKAMKSLFVRCQINSVVVDKRIIWNVIELNRVYNGAGLNDKCHIADAVLQAFVSSGFLSSNTLKLWFEMTLNTDEEAPKTAMKLYRTSQKHLTMICSKTC